MANIRNPRHGSMQYWPRKKARRIYARVRAYPQLKDAKLMGFAGYKVGMTHVMAYDSNPNSMVKGEEIFMPATIIECPPLKAASLRFYKKAIKGPCLIAEVLAQNLDKELGRKIVLPKSVTKKVDDIKDFDEVRVGVYTQPKLTGFGKKKPELFEVPVGGNKEQQLRYATELLGKEIRVNDIVAEGMYVDVHAVTKGKGLQGPVKRFGVAIRHHKSEKTKRGPGSLGAWCAQGHIMYRVAKAGQMGFHQRTEFNKQILKIDDSPNNINVSGGFVRYGLVNNPYLLLRGSVPGSKKRLIRFNVAMRPRFKHEAPKIGYVSLASQQG